MLITRTSMFSGITRSLEFDVTKEQVDAWENGMLVQHAMPHLTPDEREFFISGVTPKEWNEWMDGEEL